VYTPVYTPYTPSYPGYTPVHPHRMSAYSALGTVRQKRCSRHEMRLRFVMAAIAGKKHRLIYGKLRCIHREPSYHQCSNQLRKGLLCSSLRGYSATDATGTWFKAAFTVSTPLPLFYVLRFTRFKPFQCFYIIYVYAV